MLQCSVKKQVVDHISHLFYLSIGFNTDEGTMDRLELGSQIFIRKHTLNNDITHKMVTSRATNTKVKNINYKLCDILSRTIDVSPYQSLPTCVPLVLYVFLFGMITILSVRRSCLM